jgi:hypothetical protein
LTAGRKNISNKQDWNTPTKIATVIFDFFGGGLELDPCSNKDSIIVAKNKICLPNDGLKIDWNYRSIFINPPYGRDPDRKTSIKSWIKKHIIHILIMDQKY